MKTWYGRKSRKKKDRRGVDKNRAKALFLQIGAGEREIEGCSYWCGLLTSIQGRKNNWLKLFERRSMPRHPEIRIRLKKNSSLAIM